MFLSLVDRALGVGSGTLVRWYLVGFQDLPTWARVNEQLCCPWRRMQTAKRMVVHHELVRGPLGKGWTHKCLSQS